MTGSAVSAEVREVYRMAVAATLDTVLRVGGFRPGDRVVNYCAGGGIDSLAIARRVAPHGMVVAVDHDPAGLARLAALLDKHRLTAVVRTVLADAMTAAGQPPVPTHVTCLFGLHHLSDARLATRRWAAACPPATRLVTADWAPAGSPGSDRATAGHDPVPPPVADAWRAAGSVTVRFRIPPGAPAAGRVAPHTDIEAAVVVRHWTREEA